MQVIHELKVLPKFFIDIKNGEKSFELRKDDRDFKVGEFILLREWDGIYTGRFELVRIRYILRDCPEYGLMPGYCILGL